MTDIVKNRALSEGSKVKIGSRVVYLVGANKGATGILAATKDNDGYYTRPKFKVTWDDAAVAQKMGNNTFYTKTDFGYVLEQSDPKAKSVATPKPSGTKVTKANIKKGDRVRVKAGTPRIKHHPLVIGTVYEYQGPASWGGRLVIKDKEGYGFMPDIFEYVDADGGAETPEQVVNRLFEAKVKAMDEGIAEIRETMLKSIKAELNSRFNIKVK